MLITGCVEDMMRQRRVWLREGGWYGAIVPEGGWRKSRSSTVGGRRRINHKINDCGSVGAARRDEGGQMSLRVCVWYHGPAKTPCGVGGRARGVCAAPACSLPGRESIRDWSPSHTTFTMIIVVVDEHLDLSDRLTARWTDWSSVAWPHRMTIDVQTLNWNTATHCASRSVHSRTLHLQLDKRVSRETTLLIGRM